MILITPREGFHRSNKNQLGVQLMNISIIIITMNICIKGIRVHLLNIHEHLHHHEHLHEQHQGKPFEGVVDEHPVL